MRIEGAKAQGGRGHWRLSRPPIWLLCNYFEYINFRNWAANTTHNPPAGFYKRFLMCGCFGEGWDGGIFFFPAVLKRSDRTPPGGGRRGAICGRPLGGHFLDRIVAEKMLIT